METYKTKDISALIGLSEVTIQKWIHRSETGEPNLEIKKVGKKYKILKTDDNYKKLLFLAKKVRKHKASEFRIEKKASPKLNKIYTKDEILELFHAITINHEIPLKFTYTGEGAENWDKYIKNEIEKGGFSQAKVTEGLLNHSFNMLKFSYPNAKFNLIDLGCGNLIPTQKLIENLSSEGKLSKYILVDISKNMIKYARSSLNELFPDPSFEILEKQCDIEKQGIIDILNIDNSKDIVNIILFLGCTYGNIRDSKLFLKLMADSMSENDFLIIGNKRASALGNQMLGHLGSRYEVLRWLPDMLGLDDKETVVMNKYNPQTDRREITLELLQDFNLSYTNHNKEDSVVSLIKGTKLLLWSHHSSTLTELTQDTTSNNLQITDYTQPATANDFLVGIKLKEKN